MNVFSVEGTPLQKLPYIDASLPTPTKLGFDEVKTLSLSAFSCVLLPRFSMVMCGTGVPQILVHKAL